MNACSRERAKKAATAQTVHLHNRHCCMWPFSQKWHAVDMLLLSMCVAAMTKRAGMTVAVAVLGVRASLTFVGDVLPAIVSARTTRTLLDLLPVAEAAQGGTCPVCLGGDKEEDQDGKVYLPCFHVFHRRCISEWLSHKDLCPMCQNPVLSYIERMIGVGGGA
jgi:hypothetical protein